GSDIPERDSGPAQVAPHVLVSAKLRALAERLQWVIYSLIARNIRMSESPGRTTYPGSHGDLALGSLMPPTTGSTVRVAPQDDATERRPPRWIVPGDCMSNSGCSSMRALSSASSASSA